MLLNSLPRSEATEGTDMTSAWDKVHARYQLADDVLRWVARTGDGAHAELWQQPIEDVFGDFGTFLLHLQRRWYTTLMTRLDAELELEGDADLHKLVARAWTKMAADDPGTRAVLDAYADDPVLRAGEVRHRRIVGVPADLPAKQEPPRWSFWAQRRGPGAPAERVSVPLARSGRRPG